MGTGGTGLTGIKRAAARWSPGGVGFLPSRPAHDDMAALTGFDRPQTLGEEIANAASHGVGFVLAVAALPILVWQRRAARQRGRHRRGRRLRRAR